MKKFVEPSIKILYSNSLDVLSVSFDEEDEEKELNISPIWDKVEG